MLWIDRWNPTPPGILDDRPCLTPLSPQRARSAAPALLLAPVAIQMDSVPSVAVLRALEPSRPQRPLGLTVRQLRPHAQTLRTAFDGFAEKIDPPRSLLRQKDLNLGHEPGNRLVALGEFSDLGQLPLNFLMGLTLGILLGLGFRDDFSLGGLPLL